MGEVALKTWFDVDDLVLNDEQLAALESQFKALHAENQGRCHTAAKKASTAFHTLYGSAAELHNSVSNSLWTYTRLFSVHDLSIRRLIRAKMANIFRPAFRKAIMKGAGMSSVGIFGGEDEVLKRVSDKKSVDATLKGALLLPAKKKTKGKGKPKAKAEAATATCPADSSNTSKADGKGGSKAAKARKAMAAAKAKAKKTQANETTGTSTKKEEKSKGDLVHSACGSGCVISFNVDCDIRSDIPREADWPECFPLQSAVELVTQWGLDPSSIVTRLANPLGGRLVHNMDSLRIIGANRWVQRTATHGYRPTFLRKPPVQRRAPAPPDVSEDAAVVLDKEVQGLLSKAAIKEVAPVLGQYVSSYFA